MFDDMFLHFHELDLQLSKRCFVRRTATRTSVFFGIFGHCSSQEYPQLTRLLFGSGSLFT